MISTNWKEHRGISLIVISFLVLGITYSVVTPIFEAPDEIQHFFHVKYIADGRGLPVLRPSSEELYEQEGAQPSLYYLVGALTTFWINTDDAQDYLKYNPYVNLGVPSRRGNKNIILHTGREAFPYRGAVLGVHGLRCLSLLFGAVTVVTTYLLGLNIFSDGKELALGAAILTAFNPQFLFTNASVNNDGLITALCSLALVASVLLVRKGPSLRGYLALGVVVGLAAMTKLTGLGLLVPVGLTLLVLGTRYSAKEALKGGVIILGLIILLAGWWYVRNWVLYDDPTAMSMFFEALGGSPGRELTLGRLLNELEGFKLSYWGVFGWFNVLISSWMYRFFDLLVALGLVGLPLAVVRGLRRPRTVSAASLALAFVWMAVVGVGYIRYNQMLDAATGRLVFPAVSCFSLMLAWGLMQLPPSRYRKQFVGGLGAAMLLVALACPFLHIAPVYARPSTLPAQEVESVPNRKDVTYEGQMGLVGYELEDDVFRPGEFIHLTLYWRALTSLERDYSISLIVLTPNGDLIGQEDSYPGLGSFPTSAWEPGEIIADRCWVRIRPRTAAPTIGRLGVSVYHLPDMEHLTATEGGRRVEQVFLEPVKIIPWEAEPARMSHVVGSNLANEIDLMGYDLDKAEARGGQTIQLTLYWKARRELDKDYAVFTHIIDSGERVWAQQDDQPLGGDYPTSFWERGEVVKDRYEVALPSDVPSGRYGIEVGLYLPSTGERLPILDDAGEIQDNRVLLATLVVVE